MIHIVYLRRLHLRCCFVSGRPFDLHFQILVFFLWRQWSIPFWWNVLERNWKRKDQVHAPILSCACVLTLLLVKFSVFPTSPLLLLQVLSRFLLFFLVHFSLPISSLCCFYVIPRGHYFSFAEGRWAPLVLAPPPANLVRKVGIVAARSLCGRGGNGPWLKGAVAPAAGWRWRCGAGTRKSIAQCDQWDMLICIGEKSNFIHFKLFFLFSLLCNCVFCQGPSWSNVLYGPG